MDNSMNPYQKFVILLGSSILLGVAYFVYSDISANVSGADSYGINSVTNFTKDFNTKKSLGVEGDQVVVAKVLGAYSNTKETSQIIKKLDFKKDGTVDFIVNDTSSDSSSTKQIGTWLVDNNSRINLHFQDINQDFIFEIGDNGWLVPTENNDFYGSKDDFIFIKD